MSTRPSRSLSGLLLAFLAAGGLAPRLPAQPLGGIAIPDPEMARRMAGPNLFTDPMAYNAYMNGISWGNASYPAWEAIQARNRIITSYAGGQPTSMTPWARGAYLNHAYGLDGNIQNGLFQGSWTHQYGPPWPGGDRGGGLAPLLPGLAGAAAGVFIGSRIGGLFGGVLGGVGGYLAGQLLRGMIAGDGAFSLSRGGFVQDDPYNQLSTPGWVGSTGGSLFSATAGNRAGPALMAPDASLATLKARSSRALEAFQAALRSGDAATIRQRRTEYEAAWAAYIDARRQAQ